jgi:hypothetical protein
MSRKTLFLAILVSITLVVAGVGTYAVIGRLSDQAIWVLVGGIGAFFVVGGVGALFIIKDLAQAYVMRRMLAQDDMNDLRQMAILAKMMGNKVPNVNLRLPEAQAQPWPMVAPQQGQPVDLGAFRDTIAGEAVEIE